MLPERKAPAGFVTHGKKYQDCCEMDLRASAAEEFFCR